MNISIRLENKNDFRTVENMTREAFWDVYKPGCDEHLIINKIRETDAFNKISGRFYEDSVFETNAEELNEFEKQFPHKEKHVTDTQL